MAGNEREVTVRWREGQLFEGSATAKPGIVVDGHGAAATSPVELLLLAAATCSGADVVVILEKQRVALQTFEIAVRGTRREEQPRRYTSIHFHFTIGAAGIDETKARRAIDLSIEKYCSVLASLAPDIRVAYDLTLR